MRQSNCRPLSAVRRLLSVAVLPAFLASHNASAQTYGIATMQPGTLNHTSGSAVAKVLKEKAGLNVLVQPTAGETTLIPMVGSAEADLGIANIAEVVNAARGTGGSAKQPALRLIGSLYPLRTAFFVRKDSDMKTIADLKGKRVTVGYSAMRTIDVLIGAMFASGGIAHADIKPVLVPNVIRGAEDFMSGSADSFMFAFGGPKVREADATVGGIRALEMPEAGMDAARKIFEYGYLSEAEPGPAFVGVPQKMKVYTYDNMFFTNANVKDDIVYKIIDTLEKNKADLIAVAPVLREFAAGELYKKYDVPYHDGALKYFKEHSLEAKAIQ